MGCLGDIKRKVVVPFLVEDAKIWREEVALAYIEDDEVLKWEVFKGAFLNHYFLSSLTMEKEKFFNLKQTEEMSVADYTQSFNSLGNQGYGKRAFENNEVRKRFAWKDSSKIIINGVSRLCRCLPEEYQN